MCGNNHGTASLVKIREMAEHRMCILAVEITRRFIGQKKLGPLISALAMAVRCRSPALNSSGSCKARLSIPSCRSNSLAMLELRRSPR